MYFLSTVCLLSGARALLAKGNLDKIGTKRNFEKNAEKCFSLAFATKDVLTSKGAQKRQKPPEIS